MKQATELTVEFNVKFSKSNDTFKGNGSSIIAITPPIDENYWIFRVKLFKDQSIVAFPKFFTIGVGFAQEYDWNTNLPYKQSAEALYAHISHNKKYKEITKKQCIEAIEKIKEACEQFEKQKEAAN